MYADDLVIFSPSAKGLHKLLSICEKYGLENDIKYNATKSAILFIRPKRHKDMSAPTFKMNGIEIDIQSHVKYLGHFICDDLSDDKDIARQCRKFYIVGNMLTRKFGICTNNVKTALFKSFCTNMYTANVWCSFKRNSYNKLAVGYNNAIRIFLGLPRFCSVRETCVLHRIPSFGEIIRKLVYSIMSRVKISDNVILSSCVSSDMIYNSPMWKRWQSVLYIM